MIIKEYSTKHKDENGERLYLIRDSSRYKPETWEMILNYLKTNKAAKLLDYEIISD